MPRSMSRHPFVNAVYTGESSSTVTHALQQSQSNVPLYTSSDYTHAESDKDNLGCFWRLLALKLVSTSTGELRSLDVLVVLEKEIQCS